MRSINYFIKWNKYRGCSSIGRASALHAEGFAFKSRQLQLLCLRPTVGISTYPHEVENQVDFYTLVYRRYKWTKYIYKCIKHMVPSFITSLYYPHDIAHVCGCLWHTEGTSGSSKYNIIGRSQVVRQLVLIESFRRFESCRLSWFIRIIDSEGHIHMISLIYWRYK